ncbi:unnamed protein product [Lasius platythorax]|uniref:Uncharacterized protein n=1 Tax=Lasius platythorax TaxID=488582 RepID=A0AAV2P8K9_9HYME
MTIATILAEGGEKTTGRQCGCLSLLKARATPSFQVHPCTTSTTATQLPPLTIYSPASRNVTSTLWRRPMGRPLRRQLDIPSAFVHRRRSSIIHRFPEGLQTVGKARRCEDACAVNRKWHRGK